MPPGVTVTLIGTKFGRSHFAEFRRQRDDPRNSIRCNLKIFLYKKSRHFLLIELGKKCNAEKCRGMI